MSLTQEQVATYVKSLHEKGKISAEECEAYLDALESNFEEGAYEDYASLWLDVELYIKMMDGAE